MAELITVAKYWRDWPDHRWIVCVFNNGDLNQVTWEQRIINGDPKFEASQNIPNVSYSRFAELIGLRGIYIEDAEMLRSAWQQALENDARVPIAQLLLGVLGGDLVRVDACCTQRSLDRAACALAFRVGSRRVVAVRREAVAEDLGEDRRAELAREILAQEDEHAASLPQREAVPVA